MYFRSNFIRKFHTEKRCLATTETHTYTHTCAQVHLPSNIIVWTCLTPPAYLTELYSFMIYHCYLVNMRFKASTDTPGFIQ